MRSTKFMALLLVLTTIALLAPASRLIAKDESEEQIEAFEDKMKSADEEGKVRLIEGLAASGNPGAAAAIWKFTNNRSTAVAVAALKAMGALKEPKFSTRLMGMVKSADDDPKILAAVVDALAEYGDKKAMKTLTDVAKKWLFKDSGVASAAAKGLGMIEHKSCVDELIKLLDLTYPRQAGSGANVSDATRTLLAESRPSIITALQTLTGWDFQDAKAWSRFWEKMSRKWKPGAAEPDYATLKKWEDPGYGFVINKPGDAWKIDRSETYRKDYRVFMVMLGENDVFLAYVYVMAYNNAAGLTAQQKGTEFEDTFQGRWKDIRDESWVRGDHRVGKTKGYMHGFTGQDSNSNIAKMKNFFFVKDEMMYVLGTWQRSGLEADSSIPDEIEAAIKSFKFTD